MKSWEFLIQKEGDHQWVSIPSLTFEIEPGTYSLLANSNHFDSDLEVRISCQTLTCEDFSYNTQNYSRHVNLQGLVMIFACKELFTGILEIRCRNDIMSELIGETWQKTLKLQILDTVTNRNSFDAQIDCFRGTINDISIEEKKNLSQYNHSNKLEIYGTPYINNSSNKIAQFYLHQLEKLVKEKVEPLTDNYETDCQQSSENFLELSSSDEITAITLQLILEQDTFQGNPDEYITIAGKINAQSYEEKLALTAHLCYQLRHPYTNEMIMKIDCSLSDKTLPYTFNQTLVIPDKLEGLPYLSGKVVLQTMTEVIITHYPFKIYSREHYPVNYTIELFNTEHKSSHQFEFKVIERTKKEFTAIELPITAKYTQTLTEPLSSYNQGLPPKLKRNSVSLTTATKSLKLPPVILN
ncbi:MAG: hypothetical protein KPI85_02175 [cyanobacterium endosymbiont of Epithemia adnata isolate EadnSB Bon19]